MTGRARARRALARRAVHAAMAATLACACPVAAQPRVEVVATGLEAPWALAFAPDGRLYVTERPGRIRVVAGGRLTPDPVAEIAVARYGEAGLMGLALDPDFAVNRHLYVCYTRERGGDLLNRIARLTLHADGKAGDERVVLDGMPGAFIHDGCRLKFGPDRMLYATMGDAAVTRTAQERDSLSGKILRINADGSVPADNPFPGSPVYSMGHRNPQGLAWDDAGRLLAAEHGPSGHDEVNHILPGRNYGWPAVRGRGGDPRYVDPLVESGDRDTWAPSGIAFLGGDLFVAGLRGERLLRFTLGPGLAVTHAGVLLNGTHGRLRDVVVGPDGALYVATCNRDGRGRPARDDDRILRLRP